MKKNIRELPKRGGCTVPHFELYKCAKYLHGRLMKIVPERKKEADNIKKLGPLHISFFPYQEDIQSYVQATHIFSCMTVEATINFYGVYRLGEKLFERNYERLSIQKKMELLLATCDGLVLGDNDEIINIIKNLVKTRNSIVHPFVEEDGEGDGPISMKGHIRQKARLIDSAENSIKNMERFIDLFGKLVPEGARMFFDIKWYAT